MSRPLRGLLFLFLGALFTPSGQADVLTFARSWVKQEDEKKGAEGTIPAALAQRKESQEAGSSKQSPASKTSVQKSSKPNAKAPAGKAMQVKKPATTIAAPPSAAPVQSKQSHPPVHQIEKPADISATTDATASPSASTVVDPILSDPQLLRRWIKSLARHFSLTPEESALRQQYALLKSSIQQLNSNLARGSEENNRLQAALSRQIREQNEVERSLSEKLATQQEKIAQLTSEMVKLQSLQVARDSARQQNQTLSNSLEALEKEQSSFSAQLIEREQEKNSLLASLALLKKEKETLEALLAGQDQDKQTLSASAAAAEVEKQRLAALLAEQQRVNETHANKEKELFEQRTKLEQKDKQWQELTQVLQLRLKEAQHPPLPTTDSGLEDFAAGMSMGFGIVDILEHRDEQGVTVDRAPFIAGLAEAIRGERRLSQEEFEKHLTRASLRVEEAVRKAHQKREASDRNWLVKFIKEKGVKSAGQGAWFRVVHVGEQSVQENSSGVLTIAVNRRLTSGKVILDSDLSGLVLQERLVNLPEWLQVVIKDVKIHGEAELAVKVNDNGDPEEQGNLVEHWLIRIQEISS
ncbi:hypothetical protein OGV43_05590 [Citrobacter sp. Cb003]|uniref:FKBP-type peptidyl-prolyl cis-trans isomerase N-terminal domain-containing protein n=1 Tax=Citrobacter sp. Cb003 TaxID=2985005 RepID=UPI00257E87C5|nr:FKBP-type peptidyl-prolyl cis-trans isomerase N-terminal domain-containing protein [Citrobacter sp. Cb003]MDM3379294.1 hypothetical protein [Citrobacter sp. Cb003]